MSLQGRLVKYTLRYILSAFLSTTNIACTPSLPQQQAAVKLYAAFFTSVGTSENQVDKR